MAIGGWTWSETKILKDTNQKERSDVTDSTKIAEGISVPAPFFKPLRLER
jgi:hypothetical protein